MCDFYALRGTQFEIKCVFLFLWFSKMLPMKFSPHFWLMRLQYSPLFVTHRFKLILIFIIASFDKKIIYKIFLLLLLFIYPLSHSLSLLRVFCKFYKYYILFCWLLFLFGVKLNLLTSVYNSSSSTYLIRYPLHTYCFLALT